MKKMKVRNREVYEILDGLKGAAATAIGFVAITIAIPAKIVLVLSRWLMGVATKLAGGAGNEVVVRVDPERGDILEEITEV